MQVTTKPVKHLDHEQLQALVDEGYTYASTQFAEGMAEIIAIRRGTVTVKYPTVAYATAVRVSAIAAVHMPDAADERKES